MNRDRDDKEKKGKLSALLTKAPPLPENSSLLKKDGKEVPGNYSTGRGSSILCLLNIKATGHNYMRKLQILKLKSAIANMVKNCGR